MTTKPLSMINQDIPNGRYVARFLNEYSSNQIVFVEFQITLGPQKDRKAYLPINSKKSRNAVAMRSSGWLEWMEYVGDTMASKVQEALRNAIDGQIFIQIESGLVKKIIDPSTSERVYLSLFKEFSSEWVICSDFNNQLDNLKVCQLYYRQTGRLPTTYWNYFPKEKQLGEWLQGAIDPNSPNYLHEANTWVNEIFKKIGGYKENLPKNQSEWPKLWINTGFKKIPPNPKCR